MGDFFNGWRRKAGCVMLMMACVFMAGWVRSLSVFDFVQFASGKFTRQDCSSIHHTLIWGTIREDTSKLNPTWRSFDTAAMNASTLDAFLGKARIKSSWRCFGFGSGEFGTIPVAGFDQKFWMIPYWSIVVPLTLLSAYLLLVKPRPKKLADSH